MVFEIVFEDKSIDKISEADLDSFSFVSNISKIYSIARVVIKDVARRYFNLIKTGQKASINFFDEKKTFKNKMSILSFNKVPGPQLGDFLEITFISSFYFEDAVQTEAHRGTTSKIIYNLIKSKFKSIDNFECSDSDDVERYRYQTSEKHLDFIRRILKYGTIQESPLLLYSDALGKLNLKGEYDLRHSSPKYLATPLLTDMQYQRFDLDDTTIKLLMESYSFVSASNHSVSNITSKFSNSLFKSSSQFDNSIKSASTDNNNAQCKVLFPSRTDFYSWNLAPTDAKAIAIKKNYDELSGVYSLVASFKGLLAEELNAGNVIWVFLPYEPTAKSSTGASVNCSEGKYLVKEVKVIFEDQELKTHAHLIQVSY